jgi:hypothetical protein
MYPSGDGGRAIAACFEELSQELQQLFRQWAEHAAPWSDEFLSAYALRAFELQFRGNEPLRRYCQARGVRPGLLQGWRDVPPVPTAAFSSIDVIVGGATEASLVFRTSGTSRGPQRRGRHLVRDPGLYRASLRSTFRRHVLAPGIKPDIVTLQPPFATDRDSSLAWMLDDLREGFGGPGSFCAASSAGVDWAALQEGLEAACRAARPVLLLGTTLAFDSWLDRRAAHKGHLRLAVGSRVMDTGGVKGKPAAVRSRVVARLVERLGITAAQIVNEFGMTELLSQRYAAGGSGPGLLYGPPWLRTRALDPATLEELPEGDVGVLCHFDLANIGSACHVLTEDLGRVIGDGVEWLGRSPGAPPRGCSLATAELMAAQDHA